MANFAIHSHPIRNTAPPPPILNHPSIHPTKIIFIATKTPIPSSKLRPQENTEKYKKLFSLATFALAFPSTNAAIGLEPEDQDLSFDADGDGIDNGVEGWFGTSPAVGNAGLTQLSKTGSVFRFQHPVAAPALSDVAGSYEWSLDLAAWHPDTTTTVSETTVSFSSITDSGTSTVTVDTTDSITPPSRLFLRVVAERN